METNALPYYDDSENTTGCCPRFKPEGWDRQDLHFKDKKFVRATTKSVMHIPVNMGPVFNRVFEKIQDLETYDIHQTLVLSRDLSAWSAEHLFAVEEEVEGEEMLTLTGDYVTNIFEGPYKGAKNWHDEMMNDAKKRGHEDAKVYMFYTTCPKCAKAYGKNYVVGVEEA
jgi:hypothetical protein